MKIVSEFNPSYKKVIDIISVKIISDYVLSIIFNDNTEKEIDFRQFLEKSSHPAIKKYLNLDLFNSFEIIDGNLNWNDHDLIFPVADLYEGKIK